VRQALKVVRSVSKHAKVYLVGHSLVSGLLGLSFLEAQLTWHLIMTLSFSFTFHFYFLLISFPFLLFSFLFFFFFFFFFHPFFLSSLRLDLNAKRGALCLAPALDGTRTKSVGLFM